MELPSLDLNLLVALNALLVERNVTRAGERIGLSQPATSAALARLRRHFNDELLRRVGSGYELTALASSLLEQSDTALRYVEHTFAARPLFNAAESARKFSLIASDNALVVLGSALATLLQQRGPNVRLHFHQIDRGLVDDARNALRLHDAMLLARGYIADLPSLLLYEDDWVVVAASQPGEARVLTPQDLAESRWVMTYDSPTQFTPPDKTLMLLGIQRRVDIVVENFASIPFLVVGTDRLALLPRKMAERIARIDGITLLECPIALPRLGEALWWHPSHDADPGHRWLLELITDAARLAQGEQRTVTTAQ